MKVLYIDTSSSFLYTALVDNHKLLKSISEDYGQSLSEIALPKIASMFNETNLSPKDVDKIIVVNGPGSFTGIRIGITIAKVYAWTLNIPITTITSLEAMSLSSSSDKIHVPIIDARRGYVYAAIYNDDKTILEPIHLRLTELQDILNNYSNYEYISNDEFDDLTVVPYNPDFVKIIDKFQDKANVNPHAVNPDYLKLTEAEESKL